MEDVFHACYRHPETDDEGQWFTAAELFRQMNKRNASALRGVTAKQLSYRLTAWDLNLDILITAMFIMWYKWRPHEMEEFQTGTAV